MLIEAEKRGMLRAVNVSQGVGEIFLTCWFNLKHAGVSKTSDSKQIFAGVADHYFKTCNVFQFNYLFYIFIIANVVNSQCIILRKIQPTFRFIKSKWSGLLKGMRIYLHCKLFAHRIHIESLRCHCVKASRFWSVLKVFDIIYLCKVNLCYVKFTNDWVSF